jgi:hypothetical protein
MKNINWNEVEEAQEFKRLGVGGYICKITSATDEVEKEYLKLEYDVADGEFKNYYKELFDKKQFWGGKFIRSYKEKALPFFKGFITSVEKSNNGFKFDNDESKLIGKLVGLVIGEEEYRKSDGTVGTRLYVDKITSVDGIKKGEFLVPPIKKLELTAQEVAEWSMLQAQADETLPF